MVLVTIIALCSGGLDSVTLAYRLRAETPQRLVLVSFDYGQKHRKEIEFARDAADELNADHVLIRLPRIGGSALTDVDHCVPDGHYTDPVMRETIVPNRNMIMLSHAMGVVTKTGASRLAVAVHEGDSTIYPDCRPAFIAAMTTAALTANEGSIYPGFRIDAPYIAWNKQTIVREGEALGVPFHFTWSCYRGDEYHCGFCAACVERREAFRRNDIQDPTVYDPRTCS